MNHPSESEQADAIAPLSRVARREHQLKKRRRDEKFWWSMFVNSAVCVAIVIVLHTFVFQFSVVDGQSMQPTLHDGQWLLIDKMSYHFVSPVRGDLLIVHEPNPLTEDTKLLVKRLVAIAGDQVEVRDGKLYLNGQLTQERYTDTIIEDGDYGPYTVPAGMYFVMGDNRHVQASLDSRVFGAINRAAIVGRATYIIWPINQMTHLH